MVSAGATAAFHVLGTALSQGQEEGHSSPGSGEQMVKGMPSPKASWRECDLKQPWKEDWAVGTLQGEGHRGLQTGKAGSPGLSRGYAGSREQLFGWSTDFHGLPARFQAYGATQNFRISPNHLSEALSDASQNDRCPFHHLTLKDGPLSGHSFSFQTLPELGSLARSHCPTQIT